jgi:hypothetical protein
MGGILVQHFICEILGLIDLFIVFNVAFSHISAISGLPVLVVDETGENHRLWVSNW